VPAAAATAAAEYDFDAASISPPVCTSFLLCDTVAGAFQLVQKVVLVQRNNVTNSLMLSWLCTVHMHVSGLINGHDFQANLR